MTAHVAQRTSTLTGEVRLETRPQDGVFRIGRGLCAQ